MGYNDYTTDTLLDKVFLKSHLGATTQVFSPSNVISLASDELGLPLISQILSTRGGYYLDYEDYSVATDGLYVIPSDAIGGVLYNVQLVQDTVIVPVNIIEEAEQFSTQSPNTTSYGAFMKGNFVQILPIPNIGSPRLWFLRRPGQLVATSACAQITAVSVDSVNNTTTLTVGSYPSTFAVGTSVDILGDQPPFNILDTVSITNIGGSDITVDAAITTVVVGDWIALEDQTCVPQIPVEYRPVLEQRTVVKMYEIQGQMDKLKAAQAALDRLEKDVLSVISQRIKTQTKVINPSNGGLMSGIRRGWGNYPAGRTE